MRQFSCRCGHAVYFENDHCNACNRLLAFDPVSKTMLSEEMPGSGLYTCPSRGSENRCNWMADSSRFDGRCISCQTNRIIPNLSRRKNRKRWRKLDTAKRRMLADILDLGLPIDTTMLGFEFKEDQRSNPDAPAEFVTTGHMNGIITINAAEADPVFREDMRRRMNESYRTLLGHLRHESGHYYFGIVVGPSLIDQARALFGDERTNYGAALRRHYSDPSTDDWQQNYISSYASAHPMEDWAECWGHYLHIRAALDVAVAKNLVSGLTDTNWLSKFVELSLSLNEVMNSLGLPHAYPFVITAAVAAKIEFVHTAIQAYRNNLVTRRVGSDPLYPLL